MTARMFALLFGIVYVVLGIVGFVLTGFSDPISLQGDKLFGFFEVNPAHNAVHLLVGAALLAGGVRDRSARPIVGFVGVVYLLVGIAGFLVIDTDLNYLALNIADNLLHIGTAVLAFLAIAASRRQVAAGY